MMVVARKRAAMIVACAITSGLIVGGGIVAWAESPDDNSGGVLKNEKDLLGFDEAPTAPPKPGDDLTIGGWVRGKPAPDLMPIDLEDGRSGYLRTYDMAHGDENPAFVRRVSDQSEETVLPVYAKDGQTVIGEFVASTVSWE
ncbi:hypothetical protein GCM10022234_29700 [Aeromicrobium panaciterrae]|uniref:hypothetical protein n=1 Tax=Aeromicrobium panaciterrae TaxID=363861 RepID=UPI0031E066CD